MKIVDVEQEPLHKEVYRNQNLRIYRTILQPGQKTLIHKHSHNTIYIVVQGGKMLEQPLKKHSPSPQKIISFIKLKYLGELLFQKLFHNYINLETGFTFYLPSKKYPITHTATASPDNKKAVELLGIEIL
ncbi:hypothetical protein [Spirochaeta cellobiosiphila]|uniref:hypothetical protein n=1 Tax=Spirochaeta cellobiosiphila TaxID=504483 RepID=UPI00048E836B|nr:hypothetical protein [Spirochaeta cellobiosiphila]